MDYSARLTFDILSFSSIMMLVVRGLAVVVGVMNVLNLAHGRFVLIGVYAAYLAQKLALPTGTGLLLGGRYKTSLVAPPRQNDTNINKGELT